jgi:hypothetical protein
MWVIATMAKSVFLIFGSMGVAIVLCMLLWHLLTFIRHPEMGVLVIGIVVVAAFAAPFSHSPFLRMTLLFVIAGAVPFWIAGREWRAARKAEPTHGRNALGRDHRPA